MMKFLAGTLTAAAALLCALLVALTSPALAFTPRALNYTGSLTSGHCLTVSVPQTGTLNDSGTCVASFTGTVNWTICASGCTYTDIFGALTALQTATFAPNTLVKLQLSCHTVYTSSVRWQWTGAPGATPDIVGCVPTTHTITSIVGTSGSTGAWSITYQMGESTANITPGIDYLAIENAAGGSDPSLADNAFPVTSCNNGLNQCTVSSFSLAAAAPAGVTSGTMLDINSILRFTGADSSYAGLAIFGGSIDLGNVVIQGNGGGVNGLAPQNGSEVVAVGPFIVDNFIGCVEASDNSLIQPTSATTGMYVTRCTVYGIQLNLGAQDNITPTLITGVTGPGLVVDTGAFFYGSNLDSGIHFLSSGNTADGVQVLDASVFKSYGQSSDNGGYGLRYNGGVSAVNLFSFTFANNTNGNCNSNTASCQSPLFAFGATLGSGQALTFGDNNTNLSGIAGSNGILTVVNGLVINGRSVNFCSGSYTNFGTGAVNICGQYYQNGSLVNNPNAPVVGSGFGTGATVPKNNGTAAFTVNVGTGGIATSGAITMPTPHSSNGWACTVTDTSSDSTILTSAISTSNSNVNFTSYSRTTGASTPWNANDVLVARCTGY